MKNSGSNHHILALKTRLMCVATSTFSLLFGCVSSNDSSVQQIRFDDANRAKNLGAVLFKFANTQTSKASRAFDKLDFDEDAVDSHAKVIQNRMEKMLGRALTKDDLTHMHHLGAVLLSFEALKKEDWRGARELSNYVLFTPSLSTQTYQWAFTANAVSFLLEIDKKKDEDHENFDIHSLEREQCKILCESVGWATLARDARNAFSQNWYNKQILSDTQFSYAGLKKSTWISQLTSPKKTQTETAPDIENLSAYEQMVVLSKLNRTAEAVAVAKKVLANSEDSGVCQPDFVYANYLFGQARRRAQDRETFFRHHLLVVRHLEKNNCSATHFKMEEQRFLDFKIDSNIWLARLFWERGDTKQAKFYSETSMTMAEKAELWDLFFESAQVLIGRVGYEILTPDENLKLIADVEKRFRGENASDFQIWLDFKKGLFQFLSSRFEEAAKTFESLESQTNDKSLQAATLYWRGRALVALKQTEVGTNILVKAGATDPLSIYDIFAGQFIENPSGRVSSTRTSPFDDPWYEERDRWIRLRSSGPFALFEPIFTLNIFSKKVESKAEEVESFEASLRSSVLLVSAMRAVKANENFDDFTAHLRDANTLDVHFLRSAADELKRTYNDKFSNHDDAAKNADQIAWLLYVVGDYFDSILFVGGLRGKMEFRNTPNSFLYFIFYPRPFLKEYVLASKKCNIDIDVLYAISRQESLFQKDVVSGAGAIGLMQLLPATAQRVLKRFPEYFGDTKIDLKDPQTNIIAGACYIKDLIHRYNNNLTFAIAAYNAGEHVVDDWVKRRSKIKDMPFFTEFIPYAETQKYAQRVLRNYYNLKWIYSAPEAVKKEAFSSY